MIRAIRYLFSVTRTQAQKYIKSVSQQALLFKPSQLRQFSRQEVGKNRIVNEFFEKDSEHVSMHQAAVRLTDNPLPFSTPTHSYLQITLPFQTQPQMRKKFVRYYSNNVRGGRLLEIMDYMASSGAYRYCLPADSRNADFSVVTASVDHINFFRPVVVDRDCMFSAYATYAGTSSVEVQVNVLQRRGNEEVLSCTATFSMVARDKTLKAKHKVPPMQLKDEGQTSLMRFQFGKDRQQQRKLQAKRSLSSVAPSTGQSELIHRMFLQRKNNHTQNSNSVAISSTRVQKTLLMHLQDRNLHGKVFGGFLMRQAFELGWLCAYMFVQGKQMPEIYFIDDIQFISSVDIGSAVCFEAQVVMVEGNRIHVTVHCDNIKPTGDRNRTNSLRLCYECPEDIPTTVYPKTYDEALLYLEARRIGQPPVF